MKKLLLILLLIPYLVFANDGKKLFDAKCSMCHLKSKPIDKSKLVAPPIMGVMRHIKMNFDNKDEAINFIVDYVLNPSKTKALCMPQKIKRFGLMPSQKGNITEDELREVAGWIYDNFPNKSMHKGMKKCKVTPK